MATVNKNFKIKQGLVVEGSTATVGGFNILTENQASEDYIVGIVGGTTLVTSVESTQMEVISGELNIKSGVFDASGAAAAAQSAAVSTASADATSKANAAQSAAEATASADATTKANNAKSGAEATASADATSKANAAQAAAISAAATDATTKANAAQSAAEATAASALTSAINTEVANRNTAIGTAVDNLVDGAPALLNTLNELAAAINDDANYTTTLTSSLATKAPLASPALTGVPTAPTAAANTDTTQIATTAFAKAEADAAQAAAEATASADATSKANAAVSTASADATSKANAAQAAAIAHADALTTSDVAEGTAQYFTDARSKASAADLLTGATKTNITITGSGSGLVITAENGVADSTTSNLTEGSNLYFTDARARAAVDGTTRSFTAVELNSVAKQVAATLSAPTAGVQTAHAFAKADYRSAEYLVKIANGSNTDVSKVLLTLDSSDNIAITEYGMVSTGSSLGSVSASISGANVQLLVTTANNTSVVTVVGTLLK